MNANDRLSLDPLGRVEGGNRIVKGSHIADVSPQPTIPDPLAELTQLGAIGYNDEVERPAVRTARPVPMTYAPASRASWVAIEPTTPAAPCTRTLCPARRRPCSNSPCHAVRPDITRAAPTVKSTSPGSGARLRASTATYSASVPSRVQSVRPNTRCPTDSPVVP